MSRGGQRYAVSRRERERERETKKETVATRYKKTADGDGCRRVNASVSALKGQTRGSLLLFQPQRSSSRLTAREGERERESEGRQRPCDARERQTVGKESKQHSVSRSEGRHAALSFSFSLRGVAA